jgi:inner membrane protein
MWLWPFSDMRVAWSFISIIDLLYTLPLLLGVWFSARSKSSSIRPVLLGFALAHAYMAACGVQKLRALALRDRLAAERGHVVERSFVQNLLMTNIGWRSLYEYDGSIYADALYTPWFGPSVVREGESRVLGRERDLPPDVLADARTRDAFEIFRWFSSEWLVVDRGEGTASVCDVRYSVQPGGFEPFWCTRLDPDSPTPVARTSSGFDRSDRVGGFINASFFAPIDAREIP